MGVPSINISFIEKATNAIKRGSRGIVAIAIKEESEIKPFTVMNASDIPANITTDNADAIKKALIGYTNAPRKILVYVMSGSDVTENYKAMLKYFESAKWDYLAIPSVEDDGKTQDIVAAVKKWREGKKKVKAVLPNTAGDSEGIINVSSSAFIDTTEYPAAKLCTRIAGLIAGTGTNLSVTYAPLLEFTSCTSMTEDEMNTAVDEGKLIFMWDGDKVKIVRGVNSLHTLTDKKGSRHKKIKVIDTIDMIFDDIRKTVEDTYIGKYANTYGNKCVLIAAINDYFSALVSEGVLGGGTCEIGIDAQRKYLKQKGIRVEDLSDDEIKQYPETESYIFLKAKISVLDAIEDIELPIYL